MTKEPSPCYIIIKGGLTVRKELLKGLTEEQIKKIETCKDSNEILKLAKEEGIALNDEQLEAVAGGCSDVGNARKCPECGADNAKLEKDYDTNPGKLLLQYTCKKCGHKWTK